MKHNITFLVSLLALGILIACTQTPEQMAEKALRSSTVRLEMKDADGKHLGWGSGFFIKRDGIVTHIYVIAGATSIEAELVSKGKKFAIKGVTAFDTGNKLVILKVVGKGSKPISLGNSDNIQGSGYILGYDEYSETTFDRLLLPSLPPETTGGPILNSQGEVVGVVDITGNTLQSFKIPSVPINAKAVEELLEKSESLEKSEPLLTWQKRKPIRSIATEQLAKKKGRPATVRLISRDNEEQDSLGSGFFVERNKIVTNIHCVASTTKIQAELFDKKTLYDIIGVTAFDPARDLVVLKVAGKGPKPLSLGDSDAVQGNEPIAAVGNPIGKEEFEVTRGEMWNRRSDGKLRMKIEISPGNSGGPILNHKGQVIGVAANYHSTGSGTVGFAIPSNALEKLRESEPMELEKWQEKLVIRAFAYRFKANILIIHSTDYKKVIELLDKARGLLNSEDDYSCFLRGDAHLKLRQYQDAKTAFSKAIGLIPDEAMYWGRRGITKLMLGEYEEAIADFEEAIRLNPDYANAYSNRAATRYHWGKFEEVERKSKIVRRLYKKAIEDCKKALELNPNHEPANKYLERAKEALKQLEK